MNINYDKETIRPLIDDECKQIDYICTNFENRLAGSENEQKTAEFYQEKLMSLSDTVEKQDFVVYPKSYNSSIIISLGFMLLGYVSYFLSTAVATIFLFAAIIPFIGNILTKGSLLDPLFKKSKSSNIVAIKNAKETATKGVTIVAHMDAPVANHVARYLGYITYLVVQLIAGIGYLYILSITIARWIFIGEFGAELANGLMLYLGIAGIVFVVSWIVLLFAHSKKATEGAIKNLSGCCVATALLRVMKEENIDFINTDVKIVLTGSDEAGFKGIKHYLSSLEEKENQTIIYLDAIRADKGLKCIDLDIVSMKKNTQEVNDALMGAAKDIEIPCEKMKSMPAFSPTPMFIKKGYKCTCLTATTSLFPNYYKTVKDKKENISKESISDCVKVLLKYIENEDNKE